MLTACCIAACLALVYAEYRAHTRLRVIAKLTASAAFVIFAAPEWNTSEFARWMIVGLALGAVGDVALLGHGRRAFLGGLVAFLLGHLAYVGGLAQLVPPAAWIDNAGWLALLPVAVGVGVLVVLWSRLGSLRIPVIAYVLVIAAMVVGAIAVYRANALPDPMRTQLAAGAVLFFISDLAVARDRFVGRAFANKLWGLPAYYGGQLLIAWSISAAP